MPQKDIPLDGFQFHDLELCPLNILTKQDQKDSSFKCLDYLIQRNCHVQVVFIIFWVSSLRFFWTVVQNTSIWKVAISLYRAARWIASRWYWFLECFRRSLTCCSKSKLKNMILDVFDHLCLPFLSKMVVRTAPLLIWKTRNIFGQRKTRLCIFRPLVPSHPCVPLCWSGYLGCAARSHTASWKKCNNG